MKPVLTAYFLPFACRMKQIFGKPILSLGFRPFFLMAMTFLPMVTIYFVLSFEGIFQTSNLSWDIINWHRHEMVFGYSSAVIAGFLLTAVPNWTGQPTPKGFKLALLCGFWILGRLAMLLSAFLPKYVVAIIDIPFYFLVATAILPALINSNNKRNYFFLVLLVFQSIANSVMHFGDPELGMRMGLNIIVLIMLIIGGRVIPFFTENAKNLKIIRDQRIEKIAMYCAIGAAILDIWRFAPILSGFALLLAAISNLWRFVQWKTAKTLDEPLLWILHIGYFWLVVGMLLKSLDLFGFHIPNAVANHAFTIGGIATLTMGMMARVSLGHTGRPLKVHNTIILAFIMVNMAAFLRVFWVWILPNQTFTIYLFSATLLSLSFILMLAIYFPILTNERFVKKV